MHSEPVKPMTSRRAVDSQWLTALYLEHAPGLRRLVVGVLHDREAADDIVQTTFAKAADLPGRMEPAAIKSWLYRVAFHEALTWKRRARVAQKAIRALSQQCREAGGEGPEEALVRSETVEQVREVILSLSADEQEIVRARVYHEKTFAQIAAEMQLPLGTVLTRMRRAIDKIRRKLKPHD
jgi:RNA polymerase sigma factor (sigma-70 family)